ncbi:MAG: AraC family ligand binding domain-containing protein [Cyanobacteria bacterium P01_C01_bin.38]
MNANAIYKQRRVWQPQHINNIEIAYRDASAFSLPAHFHEELEITIMQGSNWKFDYQGSKFIVPPLSFTLTQPGEVHKASFNSQINCRFHGLRINTSLLKELTQETIKHVRGLPLFSTPVVADKELSKLILTFHKLVENFNTSILKQQSLLFQIIEKLILRYTRNSPTLKNIGNFGSALAKRVRRTYILLAMYIKRARCIFLRKHCVNALQKNKFTPAGMLPIKPLTFDL